MTRAAEAAPEAGRIAANIAKLPGLLRKRVFARILREVGFYDGDISTVVGQLSDEDARRIAIEILGLYHRSMS
jgi:hypothetical protein